VSASDSHVTAMPTSVDTFARTLPRQAVYTNRPGCSMLLLHHYKSHRKGKPGKHVLDVPC
jgi:hypothetical protein